MKKDHQLEIMDDLMEALTQTAVWGRLCLEDPAIRASDKVLSELLITGVPDVGIRDQIESAVNVNVSDYATLGIWYGIRVATALREFDPHELSQRILSRREAAV